MKRIILALAAIIGLASAAQAQSAPMNIRYYNSDSLTVNYLLAKEINEQSQKMMADYQALEKKLSDELQAMANKIERKRKNNQYKSEIGFNADVNGLNKRQEDVQKQLASEQQKIAEFAARQQARLVSAVNAYLSKYARDNGIDFILVETSAMPGCFYNPVYNITAEVISGLNLAYMASSGSSSASTDAAAPAAEETVTEVVITKDGE